MTIKSVCFATAVLVISVVVFTEETRAQITITSTDASAINAVGTVVTTHRDSTTTSIDIGSPGATSWDFSALHSNSANTFTSVIPSSSPYYLSDFPTANVVFNFDNIIGGNPGQGWAYSTQDGNGNTYRQNGAVFMTIIAQDTTHIYSVFTPTRLDLPLPFTYNSQWGSDFTSSYFAHCTCGVDVVASPLIHAETVLVDAYGPMTKPGGTIVQALRVRRDDRYSTNGGSSTGRIVSYSFMTKSGAVVTVVARDTTAPNSGSIQTNGITWSTTTLLGVEDNNQLSTGYSLRQNYPNPFNPTTTIQFSLPRGSYVVLKLFNMLGEEMTTLVSGELDAGMHKIQWNGAGAASGVYFYRLQAGDFVQTRRLVLLK